MAPAAATKAKNTPAQTVACLMAGSQTFIPVSRLRTDLVASEIVPFRSTGHLPAPSPAAAQQRDANRRIDGFIGATSRLECGLEGIRPGAPDDMAESRRADM